MFLLKETLPSKVTRKYARIQQSDEEQGVKLGFGSTKGVTVLPCIVQSHECKAWLASSPV